MPDSKAFVRKLTIIEMRAIEENAAPLNDPASAIQNLNYAMYQTDNNLGIKP